MRFGMTKEAKVAAQQELAIKMIYGVMCFAWWPKKLKDGSYVWLDFYYKYYHGGRNRDGSFFVWSRSPEEYDPAYDCYIDKNVSHVKVTIPLKEI